MYLSDFDKQENEIISRRLYFGKILIIDKTKDHLRSLIELLCEAGHTVDVCTEASLVLEMAIADLPDIIISNLCMTETEGYELCNRLKSHPQVQSIPFIAISPADDLQAKAKAFEIGANDYITTPFETKEILLRVNNHLRTRALYVQLAQQNRVLQAEIIMRHHAERQSKLAEAKFTKVFYSSPNPCTITLLSNDKHIEVNNSFCRATGYTEKEIIGRSAVELGLWVNVDDREELFQLIRSGRTIKNHEFEF
ncbi:MAG: response regulator, partial [Limnothrix sp. RL_2_0]|nr:response regulator [Limnothrix sp. RL_2_0]